MTRRKEVWSVRLDKAVALSGMTRSEAKRAIADGRVQVNGTVVRDPGFQAQPGDVSLDGAAGLRAELHLMLHKPAGVVTATEDRRLPTVLGLLPESLRRRGLGPVGRLDRDVTGLVLLTTDGQLAHRLISPKWKAEKLYRARCEGMLGPAEAEAFAAGLALSDFTAKPARLDILEAGPEGSLADVTLTEGKFHQVKRMFAAVGHPLVALERRRIGCVTLDGALAPGEYRELTRNEIDGLRALCGMEAERSE